jgi:hypothetical protein
MSIDSSGYDTNDPDYWAKRSGNFGSEAGGTNPNGSSANVDPATGMPVVPNQQGQDGYATSTGTDTSNAGRWNPYTTPPPRTGGGSRPYSPYNNTGGGGMSNTRAGGQSNFYGGQKIAGGMPAPADYQSVQQYSDAAYDNSRRYLDPQQATQSRRMNQDLINRGIDPNSDMGREEMRLMSMQQGDQDNAAAFGAMQFGQGIQDQMFSQEFANQNLAGEMERSRYSVDSQWDLGNRDLQLGQQGQEFDQMMGLEGVDFRNRSYNDGLMQYQDQLTLAMLGQNPVPVGSSANPYSPYGNQSSNGGSSYGYGYNVGQG